jgi:VIT1/CCC1 family predicted Fe2+/Mn2+ transporter
MTSPTRRRESTHTNPVGIVATARHYVRDLVYGANDGIITTFAVVSGVAGGDLSQTAILVIGVANIAADGVSMGVGNLVAIRAHERTREAQGLPEKETYPWKHGLATLLAFVFAGAIPLLPFLLPLTPGERTVSAATVTFAAQFLIGAARASITTERWWKSGAETLGLGVLVAAAAYGAGALVAWAAAPASL